ncbi:enolase [Tanacetum coccineum]
MPFIECTDPKEAFLNLYIKLPPTDVIPNLGSKSYLPYGMAQELRRGDPVTNCHGGMTDMCMFKEQEQGDMKNMYDSDQKAAPRWYKAVHKVNSIIAPALIEKHIANLVGNKTLVLLVPALNVINGASHASNKLAMQEFIILPVGASSFKESINMGVAILYERYTIR